MYRTVLLLGFSAWLAVGCIGQGINLDFDIEIGDPGLGNGAPSSSFGAAAGQPGFWNRVGFGASPVALFGLDGQPTSVVMTAQSSGSFGGTAFRNKSNTGDFALLLNDAVQIATLTPGGSKTYTFSAITPGLYSVYTYAVAPSGFAVDTPVYVEEATTSQTQIVTGPMPGNSFEYLVTHSVHEVFVDDGTFSIYIEQAPGLPDPMSINGIQIVPVPEPISFISMSLFGLLLVRRKRARR
jgi:hypothetical protein